MVIKLIAPILFFSLLLICSSAAPVQSNVNNGDLTVEVSNFKSANGQMGIALYGTADGFPTDDKKALRRNFAPIAGTKSTFTFHDLPYGTYAVAVFHDENNDRNLNTNFLGIPKEGVAISNNAKGFMGPPHFSDAKFQFSQNQQVIAVKLVYM